MSDEQEKKVETTPQEVAEKVEPPTPATKPAPVKLRYNRYGTPINGVNKSDKAPFGYHPETGEILAPFGMKTGTTIPRKRKAPPSKSTNNAHTAYLRKREDNLSTKVKDDLIKDIFGSRFQQPKELKVEAKYEDNDIDSEDEMPRKSVKVEEPDYKPYIIAAILAAGGYYLLNKKSATAPVKPKQPQPQEQFSQQEQNCDDIVYSNDF